MLYKEDWEETQEDYRAWWRRELEYPLISVTTPREGAVGPRAWSVWEFIRDTSDPGALIRKYRDYCSKTFFGGAAFPMVWPLLGPGVVAAYFTDYLHYDRYSDTTWFEVGLDWDEIDALEFVESNRWWRYTKEVTRIAAEQSHGDFIVGITDLGGIMDILASLRTTNRLLTDVVECPDRIASVSTKIIEAWNKCFDELTGIVADYGVGYSAWMGLWHEEPWYPIQCDFSAMISPKMFERIVLPQLEDQIRHLPNVIYHLDGPGEIPHLDMLLDLDGIKGIEWVPVRDNEYLAPERVAMFRKILEKKNLVMRIADWTIVEPLLQVLPHRGLFLATSCSSEIEARHLLTAASRH